MAKADTGGSFYVCYPDENRYSPIKFHSLVDAGDYCLCSVKTAVVTDDNTLDTLKKIIEDYEIPIYF